jgi:hypothetical protein
MSYGHIRCSRFNAPPQLEVFLGSALVYHRDCIRPLHTNNFLVYSSYVQINVSLRYKYAYQTTLLHLLLNLHTFKTTRATSASVSTQLTTTILFKLCRLTCTTRFGCLTLLVSIPLPLYERAPTGRILFPRPSSRPDQILKS